MLVLAPNLATDRRLFVPCLEPGTVARPRRVDVLPGGKSVNVVRALRAHGVHAELLALLPAQSAEWLTSALAAEGVTVTGVPCPGTVRDAVLIYEESGRVTVLNGPGPELPPSTWARFTAAAADRAQHHRTVVCSGSVPPGAPPDALAQLATAVRGGGQRFCLDSGPRWLAAALPAAPDLVAPNLAEAQAVLGHADGDSEPVEVPADAPEQARAAATALVAAGARAAVVTAGAAGAAFHDGRQGGFVPAADVAVVNPIGAGDSFLAGVAARLEAGDELETAVRWGTATASAAISQWRPGAADTSLTRHLVGRLLAGEPR